MSKAVQVYILGGIVVVLCVSAALLNVAYENCMKAHGTWQTIGCSK